MEVAMWTNEYLEISKVIKVIMTIRAEWEEASNGQPLDLVYGSVGLLLDDLMTGLGIQAEAIANLISE